MSHAPTSQIYLLLCNCAKCSCMWYVQLEFNCNYQLQSWDFV